MSYRRLIRLLVLATAIVVALVASTSLTAAKGGSHKWTGPISQPPLSFGQATVSLDVRFKHKGKKLIPKSFIGLERNLYVHCADGMDYYPTDGGTGDAPTSSHVAIESEVFIKKNGTFTNTDTARGDVDSGTNTITGKFHRHSASGTIRFENHRNDGSQPPGDDLTCDSGLLNWTASAP
jgi:hypothetical protein